MSNEKSLGATWVSFCWVCAAVANIIMDPILVTFGQICNFRKLSQLSHFNFCLCELTHSLLNEEHVTFHLQYNKVCLLPTILAQIQNNIL